MCNYQFRDGSLCQELNHEDSEQCLLHKDLPLDVNSSEWRNLSDLKQKKVEEYCRLKKNNFEGAKFGKISFYNITFQNANFTGAVFLKAYFLWVTFNGFSLFDNCIFNRECFFMHSSFNDTVYFSGSIFRWMTSFQNTTFEDSAIFLKTKFDVVNFNESVFHDNGLFIESQIDNALFNGMIINNITFHKSVFNCNIDFKNCLISNSLEFFNTQFEKNVSIENILFEEKSDSTISLNFNHAKINGYFLILNCNFIQISSLLMIGSIIHHDLIIENTVVSGIANFNNLQVSGEIKVNPNNILNPYAQENIFRKIKTHTAELGDKKSSDEFFYREKIALKEILKIEISRSILQLKETFFFKDFSYHLKAFFIKIIDYIFDWPMHHYFLYGVRPWRTFGYWIGVILFFAFIYWHYSLISLPSVWDYLYFSVTNAMTPGYGGITPDSGIPRLVASIEAIFGAFTWGCFLTIFARKYMDK